MGAGVIIAYCYGAWRMNHLYIVGCKKLGREPRLSTKGYIIMGLTWPVTMHKILKAKKNG